MCCQQEGWPGHLDWGLDWGIICSEIPQLPGWEKAMYKKDPCTSLSLPWFPLSQQGGLYMLVSSQHSHANLPARRCDRQGPVPEPAFIQDGFPRGRQIYFSKGSSRNYFWLSWSHTISATTHQGQHLNPGHGWVLVKLRWSGFGRLGRGSGRRHLACGL